MPTKRYGANKEIRLLTISILPLIPLKWEIFSPNFPVPRAISGSNVYGLRTLRAHGMFQASLQLVFRSTALEKMLNTAPAGWGFANAGDRNRLESFLRRAGKSGYHKPTGDSLPTVAALCEQADEQLFHSIKHTHTLTPFVDITT